MIEHTTLGKMENNVHISPQDFKISLLTASSQLMHKSHAISMFILLTSVMEIDIGAILSKYLYLSAMCKTRSIDGIEMSMESFLQRLR